MLCLLLLAPAAQFTTMPRLIIAMKTKLLLVCLIGAICASTALASRSSANYSIPAESIDAAGGRAQSANYSINGSGAGEFGAGANPLVTSAGYTGKNGYAGQLYDIVALSITAPPSNNLNETASRQIVAAPLAEDATTTAPLTPSTVAWSVVTGPVASISTGGLATAGNVYQDTLATVGGAAQALNGQLNLNILNVGADDFGAYAGDQIDDAWQVQFFGQPPNPLAGPNADPDGDNQNNLFEFTAGLIPNDPTSRFILSVQNVAGQAAQKRVIFNPLVSGRTYTVQFTPTLIIPTSWATLTGTTQSDNGNQRTVTDLSAGSAPKSYRVQITRP